MFWIIFVLLESKLDTTVFWDFCWLTSSNDCCYGIMNGDVWNIRVVYTLFDILIDSILLVDYCVKWNVVVVTAVDNYLNFLIKFHLNHSWATA